jgi:hypothetical protein
LSDPVPLLVDDVDAPPELDWVTVGAVVPALGIQAQAMSVIQDLGDR